MPNAIPRSRQVAILGDLQSGRLAEAMVKARDYSARYPDDSLSWKILGALSIREEDYRSALSFLDKAKQIDPDDAEVLNSIAHAYEKIGEHEEALDYYRQAILIRPDLAEAWFNQGRLQQMLGRSDEALACYDNAISYRQDYAKAFSNRGLLLREMGRPEDALGSFDIILALHPDSAETLNNRALVLQDLGRLNDASESLEAALSINRDFASALNNLGNIRKEQGRLDEAMSCYEQALSIQPDLTAAIQNRLLCFNYLSTPAADWIVAEHRSFGRFLARHANITGPVLERDRDPDRCLRVGFVSGDFRQHSVAFFLLPVFAHIDRQKFEIHCYSTGSAKDEWTREFIRSSDFWIDVKWMGHEALVEHIRSDAIDLLFDLAGHTKGNVLPVFAAKPAPVQISWIGYPNITGLTTMDYRLVDAVTDPPGEIDANDTECLIRMPKGFLCYRPFCSVDSIPIAAAPYVERKWITFGSFNNIAKISPATMDLWVGVLIAVPDSRLLLKSNLAADISIWDRVVSQFIDQGIDPGRLEIKPRSPYQYEHLACYADVDIALDTYPYQGTTTTCEALFMGVPVVTLVGDRHAARVGASLLTHVGLPELIATSREDYVRIAADLATDRMRLIGLRAELRERLERSPVRDEVGFTRTLETALRQMWRLWSAGESPRVFEVEAHAEEPAFLDAERSHPAPDASRDAKSGPRKKRKSQKRQDPERPVAKECSGQVRPTGEQQAALTLFDHGCYVQAATKARRLIERHPADAFGWKLLGTTLVKCDRYEEALSPLLEAIRLTPSCAETINTLGFALMGLGRLNEAIGCYQRALEVDSRYYWAHNNLGTVYRDQGRIDRAIECYDRALAIAPDYVEAHSNRGVAFEELGLLEESVTSYQYALQLDPNSVVVLNNLGKAQMLLGQLDAAQQSYRRVLEIHPELKQSFSNLLLCLNYQDNLSPRQVFDEHCAFESKQAGRVRRLQSPSHGAADTDRLLRLGFVSGDFRFHSVSFFLLPILERLDRQHFEVFCYSMSHRQDEVTQRFRALADGWLDCPTLPEPELAKRIRADRIDLLFDLCGHTSPNALLAFAARPAPVQINWIGYPNTTGLSAMDYRLVDDLTDPPGAADDYHAERLIRLPSGLLCYRPWPTGFDLSVAEPPCLGAGHITFGSFNNLSKITPTTLGLWVEILRAIPQARLLLKSHTASDIQIWNHLVERFASEGITPERLECLPRAPSYTEHLEQYQRLDVALDTFPYNGTTTTCEALFMGVPVITLSGDRHAARVGRSLMTRIGLPEFVARSPQEYVAIAAGWAADPSPLRALRAGLRDQFERSPLRDEVGFTRSLEVALRQMWRLWCAGESPRVFDVACPNSETDQSARDKKKA